MIGVVLAGGESRRFGGTPKGLQQLGHLPLALHVAKLFTQFCTLVAIEARPAVGYEALGWKIISADRGHAGKGPLAGLAAGLALMDERERLAHNDPRVAFAPCDMPRLSRSVYDKLLARGGPGAYATTRNGDEPLVSVLGHEVLPVLLDALSHERVPRTVDVLRGAGACAVDFDDFELFINVNTPEELAHLNRFISH